jgi:acetyl-CoA carboxylase carboxyltransferase component
MKLSKILEDYEDVLIADGFDDAVIGIEPMTMRVVYDIDKVIEILMDQGMDHDEAIEYYEFNIVGAYVGEQTPIFVNTYQS